VKALVGTGHTLEAQKIILARGEQGVRGSAKAAADPLQRMSVILGNVGEDIGNKLLPALNKGADILTAIPEPAYMVGAAFVTIGAGAIGLAKGINAVRDMSQGTAGILRLLGLRTTQAAVAEGRAGRRRRDLRRVDDRRRGFRPPWPAQSSVCSRRGLRSAAPSSGSPPCRPRPPAG
jgi:hypothetical protein